MCIFDIFRDQQFSFPYYNLEILVETARPVQRFAALPPFFTCESFVSQF